MARSPKKFKSWNHIRYKVGGGKNKKLSKFRFLRHKKKFQNLPKHVSMRFMMAHEIFWWSL